MVKLIDSVSASRRRLVRRVRESSACFPHLRRKRRALALWILTAYQAQLVLLVLALFFQFGFPRLRDGVLNRAFPVGVSDKVLGLFGGESRTAKYRAGTARAATAFAWIGGGSLVLLTFCRSTLPKAQTRRTKMEPARSCQNSNRLSGTDLPRKR